MYYKVVLSKKYNINIFAKISKINCIRPMVDTMDMNIVKNIQKYLSRVDNSASYSKNYIFLM